MQTFYFFALLSLVTLLGIAAMAGGLAFAAGFGMATNDRPAPNFGQLRIAFWASVGLALIAAFFFAMLGYLIGAP